MYRTPARFPATAAARRLGGALRLCLCTAALLGAGLAAAQVLEPIPEPPPLPASATLPADASAPAAGEDPVVTVTQQGETRIEEYRYRGRLYMLKVFPRVGPSYFMVDVKGDGTMVRKDSLDPDQKLPRWTLISW